MNRTINKGKILSKEITPPKVNILNVNPDKIANKRCPAVIFAANRTPKEIALAQCDTNSMITKKGANQSGQPAGINIEKKSNLCVLNPITLTARKILKLNPNVTNMCEVGVNV